ncbi:MAG: DUF2341 domain-containing protein [Planctomycetota bacterium]|jgi:hypothetical protein
MKGTWKVRQIGWVAGMGILFLSSVAQAAWYSDAANPDWEWSYRQRITVNPNGNRVPSPQNDFPVLVKLTDGANPVFENARPDGGDILFTKEDGTTKIPHEIEAFTNAPPMAMTAWVRIETLGVGPTTIYMYYGCQDAGDQENAAGVWDAAYRMVTHLQETSDPSMDSTAYANHAMRGGSTPPSLGVAGQIEKGAYFSGGGQWASGGGHISAQHSPSIDITGPFTVEAWIRARGFDNYLMIVDKYHNSGPYSYGFTFYLCGQSIGQPRIRMSIYGGVLGNSNLTGTARPDIQQDKWHHVVGVFDGSSITLYVNGALDSTTASAVAPASTPDNLSIGKRTNGWGGYSPFLGILDEVRISNTARSADWVETCYNNQNLPLEFVVFSPQVGKGSLFLARGANTPSYGEVWAPVDNLPLLQVTLTASSVEPVTVQRLRFISEGTGDESSGVVARLYLDTDRDGFMSPADRLLGIEAFSADDGAVEFTGFSVNLAAGGSADVLLVLGFPATVEGGSFGALIGGNADVTAVGGETGMEVDVHGAPIFGSTWLVWPPLEGKEASGVVGGEAVPALGGCAGGVRHPSGWAGWLFMGIAVLAFFVLARGRFVKARGI